MSLLEEMKQPVVYPYPIKYINISSVNIQNRRVNAKWRFLSVSVFLCFGSLFALVQGTEDVHSDKGVVTITGLMTQLESEDPDEREVATERLVEFGDDLNPILDQAAQKGGAETKARIELIRRRKMVIRERATKDGLLKKFEHLAKGMAERDVESLVTRVWGDAGYVDWSDSTGNHRAYIINEDWNLCVDNEKSGDDWVTVSWSVAGFPDLRGYTDGGMYTLLLLINRSPGVDGIDANPLALIHSVNALRQVGKDRALTLLREYCSLCRDFRSRLKYNLSEERVIPIASLLFAPRDHFLEWRSLAPAPIDNSKLGFGARPSYLLAMQSGIPFLVNVAHPLECEIESPADYLEYCEEHCVLQTNPILPTASPIIAVEELMASELWKQSFALIGQEVCDSRSRTMLRTQALRCLGALAPQGVDPIDEKSWKDVVIKTKALELKWDKRTELFVKGSHE